MAKEKRKRISNTEEVQKQKKIVEFNNTDPDSMDSEENPRRKRHFGWVLLVLLLICAGLGGYWFVQQKRTYNDYEVVSTAKGNNATQMSYLAYNGSLLKYSKEGISYLDKDGTVLWMESYKMKQPVAVVSGSYVAVADLNGNSVYIFNESGKAGTIETPYTICNLDVASQGVFAVVLENETENYIDLYDKYGEKLVEIRTTMADSGYPLDISLSDSGNKLVTSYVKIEGITVKNSIAAYNFDSVGQNTTDRLVGGFNNLGDTIVPKIEFLNDDMICAFGDNQFIFYSMREKPSEKSAITEFQGEIESIFYNSKYVGVIEQGADEQGSLYQIRLFDTNGNERFSRGIDFTYTNVYATENEIFVIGTSDVRIYDMQGNLRFHYAFAKEIKNVVPTGTPMKYIVVYDDATEIIKLKYTKEETTEITQ